MNYILHTPILALLFLFGSFVLTTFSTAILTIGKYRSGEYFDTPQSKYFFFQYVLKLYRRNIWQNLYFILSFSNQILLVLYAISAFYFGLKVISYTSTELIFMTLLIIFISIFLNFIARSLATIRPKTLIQLVAPITSIYLYLLFPISGPLLKLTRYFFDIGHVEEPINNIFLVQRKVKEMINESHLDQHLEPHEHKLLTQFFLFRQKLVKEVMAPRIDIFALPVKISIQEAVKQVLDEGYSRIPVYKETLDQISGFVLYKDLLEAYAEKQNLSNTLEKIVKPVIYTPENKKISYLLQEFRQKQIHIAIVVNEYGETEGIITIEDILEELVGEIEDETDEDEEKPFTKLPNGSWIIDGKMNLIDIEENLGIEIPHSSEYDTIGGYIFHCSGMIPTKGWRLHHDHFELEVIESTPRTIERVQITPSKKCNVLLFEKKQPSKKEKRSDS